MVTTTISVRIDETEKARLQRFLKAHGMSLKDWFLSALDRDLKSDRLQGEVNQEIKRAEDRKKEAQMKAEREIAEIERRVASARNKMEREIKALEDRKVKLEAEIREKEDRCRQLVKQIEEKRKEQEELLAGVEAIKRRSESIKAVFVKDLGEIKKAAMDELEKFRTEALEGISNAIERHNLTEEELAKKLDETCKELFKVEGCGGYWTG